MYSRLFALLSFPLWRLGRSTTATASDKCDGASVTRNDRRHSVAPRRDERDARVAPRVSLRGPERATFAGDDRAQLDSRGVTERRNADEWWLLLRWWWRLARRHCAVQQSSASATYSPRFIWCAIELQSDRGQRFLSHLTSPFWNRKKKRWSLALRPNFVPSVLSRVEQNRRETARN